ncbi:MAG: Calx-beta domain-containing protein [Kofleriaceae bacterium]
MRRKTATVVLELLVVVLLGSCGFSKDQFLGDAAPPPVTVGFAQESQLQDESSGAIQVIVRLSRPAPEPISVTYTIDGGAGTAVLGQDFSAVDTGTLSFETGISEAPIDLTISIDTVEEINETIVIRLSNPSGGVELGTSTHTITINAALLPRVNFSLDTSAQNEALDLVLTLQLDTPPLLASSVTIAVKVVGTTAAAIHDWTMPASMTVTFPAQSTSQTITIPIVKDQIDENAEDLVIEIANTTNVVIGMRNERTHTINNDDNPPTVEFQLSNAGTEGNANNTVNIAVSLSGPSGKVITVPLVFGGGTATENTDYTYMSKAALVFMPNQDSSLSETAKMVSVIITGDTMDEANQTIVTSLGTPLTNVQQGTRTTHTYTINDDDDAPSVEFTSPDGSAMEGDSGTNTTTYMMQLSAASERTISYTITFAGSTASHMGSMPDYSTVPAINNSAVTINIAAGMTTATIDLVVVGEETVEGADETIVMTIGTPVTNVRLLGGNALLRRTHTILDQDPN